MQRTNRQRACPAIAGHVCYRTWDATDVRFNINAASPFDTLLTQYATNFLDFRYWFRHFIWKRTWFYKNTFLQFFTFTCGQCAISIKYLHAKKSFNPVLYLNDHPYILSFPPLNCSHIFWPSFKDHLNQVRRRLMCVIMVTATFLQLIRQITTHCSKVAIFVAGTAFK